MSENGYKAADILPILVLFIYVILKVHLTLAYRTFKKCTHSEKINNQLKIDELVRKALISYIENNMFP